MQKILILFCLCITIILDLDVLWNYYRDEVNDAANESYDANSKINNNKTITSESFAYKKYQ